MEVAEILPNRMEGFAESWWVSHLPLAVNWNERHFYNLRSTAVTLRDKMLFYSQRNVKML